MKKIFLSLSLILGFLSPAKASEVDILATLTNGALSENSAGVRVLSLDEKMQIKGGYIQAQNKIAPFFIQGGRHLMMFGIRYVAWGSFSERHPINSGVGIHGWRP